MQLEKPGSAKALFKFNDNSVETATFQMKSSGDVVYQAGPSIWYVTYADKTFRDLEYEIKYATIYALYKGDTSHYPVGGHYFWKNEWLVYRGNGGMWAYHFLQAGPQPYDVLPVVLDYHIPNYAPCGESGQISYGGKAFLWRYPQVLTNGTLMMLTLESTDGATGATGHIRALDSPIFVAATNCTTPCLDQGNGGHGTCAAATCNCNTGWTGPGCTTNMTSAPYKLTL
jgi:hypothetical protein